jgi:hypothetical protein
LFVIAISVLFVCDCFVANGEQYSVPMEPKSQYLFIVCLMDSFISSVRNATYPNKVDLYQKYEAIPAAAKSLLPNSECPPLVKPLSRSYKEKLWLQPSSKASLLR